MEWALPVGLWAMDFVNSVINLWVKWMPNGTSFALLAITYFFLVIYAFLFYYVSYFLTLLILAFFFYLQHKSFLFLG